MKFFKLKIILSAFLFLLSVIFVPYTQAVEAGENKNELGEFKIGDTAPFTPGEEIQHPYHKILLAEFYIYLWSPYFEYECVNEECGKNGKIVSYFGGWLGGTGTLYEELVPLVNSSKVESLIIVADKNSKVVGVYPNKDMPDIPGILAEHKDLANFNLLKGLDNLEFNFSLPFLVKVGNSWLLVNLAG